jgi:ABC-2 type transport system permease protein
MGELRAAIAIARKDIQNASRYRFQIASSIFTPLYQGVLPALLFGASFAVAGHVVGLEKTIGTQDLAGFVFLGGVMSGLTATAFWAMAMSIRNEMEMGTLEPTWLTPTSREVIVLGRALGGLFWFALSQIAIFGIGIAFFGLRFRPEIVQALPAVAIGIVAMVGVAYVLAAVVLLIKEANFFIDCTNYLFGVAIGAAFPITLLPGVLQPVSYLLPTTYTMDLIRQHGLGTRPLFDPALEYVALILTTAIVFPIGLWAYRRADGRIRRLGTINQY